MGGWSRGKLRQWWRVLFVLGILAINYPFLQIFNRPVRVAGFPLLFLYFLVGWAGSIAVIAGYVWLLRGSPGEGDG